MRCLVVLGRNLMSKVIHNAVESWRDQCLINDGSLFSKNKELWTTKCIDELRSCYKPVVEYVNPVRNPFITELENQISTGSSECRQLMAEVLWILYLYASDIKKTTKRDRVRDVWFWSGGVIPNNHPLLSDSVLEGINPVGKGFGRLRFRYECEDFLEALYKFKKLDKQNRQTIVRNPDNFAEWLNGVIDDKRHITSILRHLLFP